MNFQKLMFRARAGDSEAIEELLAIYKPLLLKESIVDNTLDEDLYQELCITFLRCIQMFDPYR